MVDAPPLARVSVAGCYENMGFTVRRRGQIQLPHTYLLCHDLVSRTSRRVSDEVIVPLVVLSVLVFRFQTIEGPVAGWRFCYKRQTVAGENRVCKYALLYIICVLQQRVRRIRLSLSKENNAKRCCYNTFQNFPSMDIQIVLSKAAALAGKIL